MYFAGTKKVISKGNTYRNAFVMIYEIKKEQIPYSDFFQFLCTP